jgi:hypothetical protein
MAFRNLPNHKMALFSKTDCTDFVSMLLINGNQFLKYICIGTTPINITVGALGAQMRVFSFLGIYIF